MLMRVDPSDGTLLGVSFEKVTFAPAMVLIGNAHPRRWDRTTLNRNPR